MSPVSSKPVKSSRCAIGEDDPERSLTGVVPQHRRSLNNRCCAHHHGGVGGRGMPAQAVSVKIETRGGGPQSPNARTSVHNARRAHAAPGVGAAHSSDEGGNDAGAKGPRLNNANSEAKDGVMALETRIVTPEEKVRQLQRRLYRKAKADKCWRAWTLYGNLCDRDILETAAKAVIENAGTAGLDGMTTMQLKENMAATLTSLQTELTERRYKPGAVKRVWIPKADGKRRPLGIPNVRDRIVQTALMLLMQPIYEADFHENSFAYRPRRKAQDAIEAIRKKLWRGQSEVIDADLSGYFDTINHAALMRLVARRVSDGTILALLKATLRAPIVEQTPERTTIQPNRTGTPQGGIISPLLANLYLNSLDHGANAPGTGATLIRYADDFVILCWPGKSAPLYQRLKRHLESKQLKLNETKTRVLNSREETFVFLGFEFSYRRSTNTGNAYVHVQPAKKARRALREAIREQLNHWTQHRSCAETVRALNAIMRGWAGYYHYGHCAQVMSKEQRWVRERLRRWLWSKYGRKHSRWTFFSDERLEGQYGLWRMYEPAKESRKPNGRTFSESRMR